MRNWCFIPIPQIRLHHGSGPCKHQPYSEKTIVCPTRDLNPGKPILAELATDDNRCPPLWQTAEVRGDTCCCAHKARPSTYFISQRVESCLALIILYGPMHTKYTSRFWRSKTTINVRKEIFAPHISRAHRLQADTPLPKIKKCFILIKYNSRRPRDRYLVN